MPEVHQFRVRLDLLNKQCSVKYYKRSAQRRGNAVSYVPHHREPLIRLNQCSSYLVSSVRYRASMYHHTEQPIKTKLIQCCDVDVIMYMLLSLCYHVCY